MKRPLGKIAVASLAFVLSTGAATWAQAQTLTVLYGFTGGSDGGYPQAGLIMDAAGNIYGTTRYGGNGGAGSCASGTVFKLDPSGKETVLHSFPGGSDGCQPVARLLMDAGGNLYGTTVSGGASGTCNAPSGCGIVFRIGTSGNETVLHNFMGTFAGGDGATPLAGLIMDKAGNLYGTTSEGGGSFNCSLGCGTVFRLDPVGNETVLYSFTGPPDGVGPGAALIMDAAGNLYGTTAGGGSSSNCSGGCGTVFKLDPSGHEKVLYSFAGGSDGIVPEGVIMDATGNLYGTTGGGGSGNCTSTTSFLGLAGCGTVFELDPVGNETVLYRFTGSSDGEGPTGDLIMDATGNLYGTTTEGGSGTCFNLVGCGTVFKLDPVGNKTVLHSFAGFDGKIPFAGVIMDKAGNLYGTTVGGPGPGSGEVFRLSLLKPVAGDFDGDHKSDIAIWRPSTGTWFVIPSSSPNNAIIQQWGASGDIPVRGDYDGDGKTDFAVWRPSNGTWFIIPSSNPSAPIVQQWGTQGDIPVPGDYDGDGKTDFAVWRPSSGTWFIIPSSNPSAPIVRQWGTQGDILVPGDYDGDGKTDFAVFRPSNGTWFIIASSNPSSPIIQQWGTSGDIPVPVDYDGDLKTDIAVWRPSGGNWFIIPSSAPSTFTITQWGTNGDVPIQKPIGQ